MALYLVSYDIAEKDKSEYQPLYDQLISLSATKILLSEWLIPGDEGKEHEIYFSLSRLVSKGDRLLVNEITKRAVYGDLLISSVAFQSLLCYARS